MTNRIVLGVLSYSRAQLLVRYSDVFGKLLETFPVPGFLRLKWRRVSRVIKVVIIIIQIILYGWMAWVEWGMIT